MRWYWIDCFLEFESGRYATSVKNISLGEDHMHDHYPHAPVMPNSLVIEGLAQTGGLLVSEQYGWEERVVLGKIAKARFHYQAVPGDKLYYRTDIIDSSKDGAIIRGTSHVGERLQAELELYFVHIDEGFAGKSLFEPVDFLQLLHALRVFQVGRKLDGSPIDVPECFAEPERARNLAESARKTGR